MVLRLVVIGVLLVSACAMAQQEAGLVASWSFDEGTGEITRDAGPNSNDATLHGPAWIKRGDGYALSLDGINDYVDCGNGPSLDLKKEVTLQAWIKPMALPGGEPLIFGKHHDTYGLTMYKDGQAWFYISGGGNNIKSPLSVGQWHYVVATFDGKTMTMYINRYRMSQKVSQFETIEPGKNFLMGVLVADPTATDPASPEQSHWRGMIDDVKVYDRALSEAEVMLGYKASAGGYGVDASKFDKLQLALQPFPSEDHAVALVDFSNVFPRPDAKSVTIALSSPDGEQVQRTEMTVLPNSGSVYTRLQTGGLRAGEYSVSAELLLADDRKFSASAALKLPFDPVRVPAPGEMTVGPLPARVEPPRFTARMAAGGGIVLELNGRTFPIESSFSFPGGGENLLAAGPVDKTGEAGWQVRRPAPGPDNDYISASGASYDISRQVQILPGRVVVRDTVRNKTDDVLGVIIDNRLDAAGAPFSEHWISGYPNSGPRGETHSPSLFTAWDDFGVGLVPLDDVYILQSYIYALNGRAGIKTERFGLAPGASHTVEWAIYPTAVPDYYEFINAVRRDEGRNGTTVEGGFAFIPQTPPISVEHAKLRNTLYGSFGCLCNVADDPEIEIEGLEFLWLPKERARLRERFDAIRKIHPDMKLMFHIAHSLVSTNKPTEMFPDARVLEPNGNHVTYPADYETCPYFSPARRKEGWKWYIYYPAPGNSFHDALLDSVDVMIDDIGCTGAFMDGFMYGYGSRFIYDKWDGHTVEIDPETKTVTRKVGDVLLLSQPSMEQFALKMQERGAVTIANGPYITRTVASMPLIVDQECTAGPSVHLAQTSCSLANPQRIKCEEDVYTDVLDKLYWGNLFFYYGEGTLTYPSLPQQMFPITMNDIRSGCVSGEERIVTMNPGIYGWPGDRDLHFCYKYSSIGMRIPADFVTTVDRAGIRTRVDLAERESAVVKRIPMRLIPSGPVNVVIERYDEAALVLSLNGSGVVEVQVKDGDFPIRAGAEYSVSSADESVAAEKDGTLRFSVQLDGPMRVTVKPAG